VQTANVENQQSQGAVSIYGSVLPVSCPYTTALAVMDVHNLAMAMTIMTLMCLHME
jgi:hypothetical protein